MVFGFCGGGGGEWGVETPHCFAFGEFVKGGGTLKRESSFSQENLRNLYRGSYYETLALNTFTL